MKWRNQLLALFCLLVFLGLGVLYFRYWVVQKPFGIILFVAEGLDPRTLAAARVYADRADKPLAMDALQHTALLKNYSQDSTRADAAAAATAFSTGAKVNNGAIAIDPEGHDLPTLLQLARAAGRMTGLVSNGSITSPTAAAFYAHSLTTDEHADFALQLTEKAHLDLVLGGAAGDFYPRTDGGNRTDNRRLLAELETAGYEIVRTLQDLEEIPRWRRAKLFGFFGGAELAYNDDADRTDDQPTLADMVRRAIELLQFNRGGYVLVVDVALIRKAVEENATERALRETVELDRAISVALEYAGNKSAVFVCSDVTNTDRPITRRPAASAEETPAAPSAAAEEKPPVAADDSTPAEAEPLAEVASSAAPTPDSTPEQQLSEADDAEEEAIPPAEDVVAFGSGLGTESLHGILDNTAVFKIIRDNL